jgi:DNA repair protein RAD5
MSSNNTKKSNIGSVLLVSMKAGGVGLNLVAASTVFIADPWWNAAVEDQCINRVHRIGQTADKVRVRKFYVFNSVEERIVKLQGRKNAMSREVLCDDEDKTGDGPKGAGMRPTLDDFKILFRED